MSVLANVSGGYPAVSFKNVGDSVAGRIISTEDYQEKIFDGPDKGKPRTYPKTGDPVMATKIVLETAPGDESSRVTLYAQGGLLIKAIVRAFREAGASDVTVGDEMAVTFTGMDGRAKTYAAAYDVTPAS